jgi:hypothetical protein
MYMATPQITSGSMELQESPELTNEWNFDTQALHEAAKETKLANPEWWVDQPENREQIARILGEPGISIVTNAYWASREFNELHKAEVERYEKMVKEAITNNNKVEAIHNFKNATKDDPIYKEWCRLSDRYNILWLKLSSEGNHYGSHNIEIAIIYAKKANIIFSEEVKES